MSGIPVSTRSRGALALGLALMLVAPASLPFGATAARAEGAFFSFFDASPDRVAVQLERSGYRIRGALFRRGDIYVCDVVDLRGQPQRLVLDAHDGRILQRYPARGFAASGPRAYALREDSPLANDPHVLRPLVDTPLLPPRSLPLDAASPPDRHAAGRSQPLFDFPSAPEVTPEKAKPKPKLHLAKPKPAPSPATEANANPTATEPPAEASPLVAPSSAAAPAPAPTSPAPVAEARTVAPAPVATPAPVKPAEAKPGKKPINDLPVDPLN